MADSKVTRRDFVRGVAVATVGAALGLSPTYTVHAGNPEKADTGKILNYNSDMEYRRCGKTNLMISAVCLGGHWKRIDKVVPEIRKGEGWMAASEDSPEFEKNRYDVVTRCIERGINYIDACMEQRGHGLQQGAQGPPRQDVPGLLLGRSLRSGIPNGGRSRNSRRVSQQGSEGKPARSTSTSGGSPAWSRAASTTRPRSRASSRPWNGRRRAAGPASPASPRTTVRTSRSSSRSTRTNSK